MKVEVYTDWEEQVVVLRMYEDELVFKGMEAINIGNLMVDKGYKLLLHGEDGADEA